MRVSNYSVVNRKISFCDVANITGNENVDTFHFDFDSEWDDFNYKYLVLIVGTKSYIDLLDSNNNVVLRSIAYDKDNVTFGVCGVNVPLEEPQDSEDIVSNTPILSTNIVWLETIPSAFGQIKEVDGLPDKTVWELYTEEMLALLAQGQINADASHASAQDANASKEAAQLSATSASTSATNAQESASSASTSANNAQESASSAGYSATAAKTSEDNAKSSETAAKTSEDNSKDSENAAKGAKTDAQSAASSAQASAQSASSSATAAANSASDAATSAASAASTVAGAIENIQEAKTGALNAIDTAKEEAVRTVQQEGASYDTRLTALETATWRGTQAEYDALETKSDDTIYLVLEGSVSNE